MTVGYWENAPYLVTNAMLFIHPTWIHENQRLGMRECTPVGYALHVIAELIGHAGLFLLLAVSVILFPRGTLQWIDLWVLAVPFGLGAISEALYQFSWRLALRKGFWFDCEQAEASWMEVGEYRRNRYPA